MIEIKNDLALFVNECLAAASPHLKSDEGSAAIQAVEYSNIGAFIDVKGAVLAHPLQNPTRTLSAGATIDDSEATIMLHCDDTELHRIEMYFDAGRNLESWNRRIDRMQFLSAF
ncbi:MULTISPECIES: hypothetical protein [Bosea]|uniref:hypothetical protein n=1 Tax=Bosea TaxID=85413 RepID=UPI00214FF248|nr:MULTISPECIES: hypothetical protein [Bosea]MCR4522123.1 hypothetical protein [Bosea sp. 47.2.35]MDR6830814.1 hypothetical protein [Bosea robiniae]MDR6895471.1 hypothetical protein [Bosea sp. BE109]MDR7138867.1 hypothetical protein [Bosea sp. BE168]MDR7175568.1 hypothetical protein [Bosea sp. BE271]